MIISTFHEDINYNVKVTRLFATDKSEFSVLQENPTLFQQTTSSKPKLVQLDETKI